MHGFVDVHSHVVPSYDDGARSIEEGLELCRVAYEAGTEILNASVDEFGAHMKSEYAKWGRLVRESGARIE